jgi:hypothetical protein
MCRLLSCGSQFTGALALPLTHEVIVAQLSLLFEMPCKSIQFSPPGLGITQPRLEQLLGTVCCNEFPFIIKKRVSAAVP